ncbi:hypothetical protein FJO69_02525 [[Mycoplasma] falconis]|uniref:Uncharacterized protein n=1 Tax=[Mycoplasma] falconis TaxID=92403 RepID=A0A501X9P5_9BACT|nr:hypothetical protein [[Mycoplasma] falconis]TPE57087.1 hypothetical protein FJO69_02525 [[Mycoplasma] falconis]
MENEKVETAKKTVKQKQYFLTKDSAFLWTLLALFNFFLIVISFLRIKGLSTIHLYSVNVLFGCFSVVFYVWMILLCVFKIFKINKTKQKGVFNFSLGRLAVFFIAISMFITTIYYTLYIVKDDKIEYTTRTSFSVIFNKWFDLFSDNKNPETIYTPYGYTPGVLFTLFYAICAFTGKTSGVAIAYVVSLIFIFISIALFFISDSKFKLLSPFKKVRQNAKAEIEKQRKKGVKKNWNQVDNKNEEAIFIKQESKPKLILEVKENTQQEEIEIKTGEFDFGFENDNDLITVQQEEEQPAPEKINTSDLTLPKLELEEEKAIENIPVQIEEEFFDFEEKEKSVENEELEINNQSLETSEDEIVIGKNSTNKPVFKPNNKQNNSTQEIEKIIEKNNKKKYSLFSDEEDFFD